MKTPICDFIDGYASSGVTRLHMPGHKGKPFIGAEDKDITEIFGADELASPKGVIAESEKNAAELFGSKRTLFCTEGCTQAIKQMLYLSVMHALSLGKEPYILAGRNAHKAFVSAAAEIGFEFDFIKADGGLIRQNVTPAALEIAFAKAIMPPTAVYLTSPDYLGNVLDIEALKKVCEMHGAILIVDNAHGAYLKFLSVDRHPLSLGADMCADSAHKTLPSLTGGAYLHINSAVYGVIEGFIENARSIFSSSSPSWLTLYSLDKTNYYLSDGYKERLDKTVARVARLKKELTLLGFETIGDEPLKITVATKSFGHTGERVAEVLRKNGVEAEFCDKDYIVLMITPENDENDLEKALAAFRSIKREKKMTSRPPKATIAERAMSPREAAFSLTETIAAKDSVGKIFASCALSCPPAVPIVVAGEIIDKNAIAALDYYGIENIKVIKE